MNLETVCQKKKKSFMKGHTVYDSIYMTSPK